MHATSHTLTPNNIHELYFILLEYDMIIHLI